MRSIMMSLMCVMMFIMSASNGFAQSLSESISATVHNATKNIGRDVNNTVSQSLHGVAGVPAPSAEAAVSFVNTDFRGQSFRGQKLAGASFLNVKIYDSNFDGVDLSNARFTNVTFHNTSFRNTRFSAASFMNVKFLGGDLRGSAFDRASLTNVTFSQGIKLYGVDLTRAKVTNVKYDGADFETANVVQSSTIATTLSQAPAASRYHTQANIDLAILFAFDSDKLRPGAWKQLQQLSQALNSQQLRQSSFLIEGHTDNAGGDDYNVDLSYRRAFSVRKALIQQLGVAENRLSAKGYGEARPVASNASDAGRATNRRVTIVNLGAR